jgi:ubiquinone/menaquinone biosynthesis C-methylase UbiE
VANVDLRRGELEALPIDDGRVDAAVMVLVLHHAAEPEAVLREMARVLRPGGRALVIDMLPHDREAYRQMGHVWLGFGHDHVSRLMGSAGFEDVRIVALPPDARAKGPALFVATASSAQKDAQV